MAYEFPDDLPESYREYLLRLRESWKPLNSEQEATLKRLFGTPVVERRERGDAA